MLSFLLSFMTCEKVELFSLLVWQIPNVFMHNLPEKKLIYSYVSGYGSDWLDGIIVNDGQDLRKKFGSSLTIKMIRLRFPSCSTFLITIGLFQLFWNPLHSTQVDMQTQWNFSIVPLEENDKQNILPFPNFWKRDLHRCAGFILE